MTAAFTVRPARARDAAELAPRLRAADRREIAALGLAPAVGLAASLEASERAFAGCDAGGAVAALFGVGRDLDCAERFGVAAGAPWLLGSEAMAARPRETLRLARLYAPALAEGFELLANRADARNRLHLAWIRALGFSLIAARPLGPERRMFVEFAKLVG